MGSGLRAQPETEVLRQGIRCADEGRSVVVIAAAGLSAMFSRRFGKANGSTIPLVVRMSTGAKYVRFLQTVRSSTATGVGCKKVRAVP